MFPEFLNPDIGGPVNDFVDVLVQRYGDEFTAFANVILRVLLLVEKGLRGLPWWLVLLLTAALGKVATRSWGGGLITGLLLLMVGILGHWDQAMQTLALMVIATLITVLIGVPGGIVMASSATARRLSRPILDAMQTMPAFVYLIPAIMLFGLGKVPAILATVIYALPPLMRMTDLGIRLVDPAVLEAGDAFGARPVQQLLVIRLPLALPNIMAGINQAIMMALSMVVIASMIGARGLGEQVLLGIQRLDVGQGLTAGLAIVGLAIALDRISQGLGRRAQIMTGEARG